MLDRFATTWVLLADEDRFRLMSEGFRGQRRALGGSDLLLLLLIVAGMALAVWGLSRLAARRDRDRRIHSPKALFSELCQAHGLDRPARQLLLALARQHGLAHPAQIFVQPELCSAPSGAGPLQSRRAEIESLRGRLFGPPPTSPAPTSASIAIEKPAFSA
jgi:hypothetical protein